MTGLELAIDAAIRRRMHRARCEYRAGSISLDEMRRILRECRETMGGE